MPSARISSAAAIAGSVGRRAATTLSRWDQASPPRPRAALDAVVAGGGTIVREIDPDAGEVFAWFADPADNVLGVYEQPGLAETERAAAKASRG